MKRAADKMFAMSWVITVGPHPDDLWVVSKANLATLLCPKRQVTTCIQAMYVIG